MKVNSSGSWPPLLARRGNSFSGVKGAFGKIPQAKFAVSAYLFGASFLKELLTQRKPTYDLAVSRYS